MSCPPNISNSINSFLFKLYEISTKYFFYSKISKYESHSVNKGCDALKREGGPRYDIKVHTVVRLHFSLSLTHTHTHTQLIPVGLDAQYTDCILAED